MWRGIALLGVLVACKGECPPPPQGRIVDVIIAKCGKPPAMDAVEMSNGPPGSPAEMIGLPPETYRRMLEWRDCTGKI